MITVEIIGDQLVDAKLRAMPQAIRARLREAISSQIIILRDGVKTAIQLIFTGGRSSGRLYNSITSAMSESADSIQGAVSTHGVPYARIQEFGGITRPHLILPKRAAALVFMGRDGKLVFAKRVNHPGSNIPERSYMRSTLTRQTPEITAAIAEAVGEGVRTA